MSAANTNAIEEIGICQPPNIFIGFSRSSIAKHEAGRIGIDLNAADAVDNHLLARDDPNLA